MVEPPSSKGSARVAGHPGQTTLGSLHNRLGNRKGDLLLANPHPLSRREQPSSEPGRFTASPYSNCPGIMLQNKGSWNAARVSRVFRREWHHGIEEAGIERNT